MTYFSIIFTYSSIYVKLCRMAQHQKIRGFNIMQFSILCLIPRITMISLSALIQGYTLQRRILLFQMREKTHMNVITSICSTDVTLILEERQSIAKQDI